MIRFVLRFFVIAAVIFYVFPQVVPGVALHGSFWPDAVVCAFVLWLAGIVVGLLSVFFVVFTAGLGAIFVALLSWLFYAVALQLTAYWSPHLLTVSDWGSAIGAGLILLLVQMVLNALFKSNSK